MYANNNVIGNKLMPLWLKHLLQALKGGKPVTFSYEEGSFLECQI